MKKIYAIIPAALILAVIGAITAFNLTGNAVATKSCGGTCTETNTCGLEGCTAATTGTCNCQKASCTCGCDGTCGGNCGVEGCNCN